MDYPTTVRALAICIAENVPVVLWGKPGQGKTSVIQGIADRTGLHLETVIASVREPTDFAGLPFINNGQTGFAHPDWAVRVAQEATLRENHRPRGSIVFYDEISTAPPAVQAAMLRPILEGVVGNLQLPKATRTIAAANPPDIAADGWDLSLPTANRFVHLDWELPAAVVREGFTRGWPVVDIPRLPQKEVRAKNLRIAKTLVGAFLGSRPELVTAMPKNYSGGTGKETFTASDNAYPTPRSWEFAARLYAAARAAQFANGEKVSESVINLLLTGTIGKAATIEFMKFTKSLNLPDPEALLSNPSSFTPPRKGDELFAVLSSVQHAYNDNPSKERWLAWGDILTVVATSDAADVAVVFAKDWLAARPQGAMLQTRHREAFDVLFKELDPDKGW